MRRSPGTRLRGLRRLLPAAMLLLVGAGNPSTGVRARKLVELPEQRVEIGDWMKRQGWSSKRNSPRRFEVGGGLMHLVSDDDSVLIGTRKGFPLDPEAWPRLRFRLRVDRVPTKTDLTRKSGDDAAFRLYVAFDRGGSWISPPDTIAYTWSENLAAGTVVKSPHYKRLHYLSLGQGPTVGAAEEREPGAGGPTDDGWVTLERDLVADYRRVFGRAEVPDLVGFMLKCDSNNTETSASAWLADVELVGAERDR